MRVAVRQIALGVFGLIFVLLLLPIYNFGMTIAIGAAALAGPLLFLVGVFAAVFVIMLPFNIQLPLILVRRRHLRSSC